MNSSRHNLIHALTSQYWYIQEETAMALFPTVVNLLQGGKAAFDEEKDSEESQKRKDARVQNFLKSNSQAAVPYDVPDASYYRNPPFRVGNVGVIPVFGTIMQYDSCAGAGTKTIIAWYEQMLNDPEIVGVVELCSSGGGSVLGTSELANYKLRFKQQKPIVSLCEGLMCSAMYYIGSASNHILVTSKSIIAGSIGVMTTYVSWKEYYKKMGVAVEELYSETSPKKNHAHRLASKGDFSGYEKGLLFELDKSFMDFVKLQRPDITEDALQGTDYTTEKAIANGLVDAEGDLNDAIAKVQELAKSNQSNTITQSNTTRMFKNFMQSIATAIGFTVAAKADNTEHSEEEFGAAVAGGIAEKINGFQQSLNTFKTEYDGKIEAFQKELKAEQEAHAKTQTALEAAQKKLAELETKVPGASTTNTQQQETDPTQQAEENWTEI